MADQRKAVASACPDWLELSAMLSGESGFDTAAIEAHVETCHECQHRLTEMTSGAELALPKAELPNYLTKLSQGDISERQDPDQLPEIPGFDVTAVLGRGGMGVVYRARHERLNREVAVKVLAAGIHAHDQYRARLHREGRLVAKLEHPNIVRIFDSGEHNGLPYLVLECVDGGSLNDLRKKIRGADTVARIIEILAKALEVAHSAGVIHRDLKPANVLLSPGDSGDESYRVLAAGNWVTPRIADFGLSKDISDNTAIVNSTGVMGTPGYMAPEQVNEDHSAICAATDIHALGVMMYELLSGDRPFDGSTHAATLHNIAHAEAPRMTADVPPDLKAICFKCLEKNISDRFASAAELAEDLDRFRNDKPLLHARPNADDNGRGGGRLLSGISAAFAAVLLFSIIRIQTNLGTVEITCHDPALTVEILRNQQRVETFRVADGPVSKSLFAGDIEIVIPSMEVDRYQVSESRFELKRGQTKRISIERVSESSSAIPKPAPAGPGKTDRSIAQWLLGQGASVELNSEPELLTSEDALPDTEFHLTGFRNDRSLTLSKDVMEAFGQLSHLQTVRIGNARYDGDGLHHLNNLKNLRVFDAYGTLIRDQHFMKFENYLQLQRLSLGFTDITSTFLPKLNNAKNLSTLRVSEVQLMHPEASGILSGLDKLVHLDLYEATDQSLSLAASVPAVSTVNLYHGRLVTDAGIEALATYPKLKRTTIQMTDLSNCDLSLLAKSSGLIRVEFLHCGLSPSDVAEFAKKVPGCDVLHSAERDVETLVRSFGGRTVSRATTRRKTIRPMRYRDLEVDEIYLDDVKILRDNHFDGFRYLRTLKKLHVQGCPIDGAGLKNVTHLESLKEVNLRGSKIDDKAMAFISKIEALRVLSVARTNVTPEGLKGLNNHGQLNELHLSVRQLSSDAASGYLKAIPKLSDLRVSQVHDIAIQRIEELPLNSLSINDSTGVTDRTFEIIAGMKSLRVLRIGKTSATENIVEQLKQMTHLTELSLPANLVTDENLAELAAALPDCKIASGS